MVMYQIVLKQLELVLLLMLTAKYVQQVFTSIIILLQVAQESHPIVRSHTEMELVNNVKKIIIYWQMVHVVETLQNAR